MSIKIRALLLAAGYGSRLRPLTNSIPKCLVQVGNQPLLARWLDSLTQIGCKEVLINTHYLDAKVQDFLESKEFNTLKIKTSYEKELLGTAGTLLANTSFFRDSLCIMLHADNVTSFNLSFLIDAHKSRPKNTFLTMLTFNSSDPSSCGIVETYSNGIVKSFHEKISNPPGKTANAAVYVFDYSFLEYLKHHYPSAKDFSLDILPSLLGRIYTFHTNEPYFDIGTPVNLKKALEIFPNS